MIYVGLTGGICSGKSLAAHYFEQLGCGTIDLDDLAKKVTQIGQNAHRQIVVQFGANILIKGTLCIDRKRLREIIFSDPAAKKALENIVLPELARLESNLVQTLSEEGKGVIVTHGATILESDWFEKYHKIVVVSASKKTQLKRLMMRDGVHQADALRAIDAQTANETREQFADVVVYNNGTHEELKAEIAKAHRVLIGSNV